MKNLNKIGEELFNKIRGRFPEVTIGDEDGNVTNTPSEARFFDFEYTEAGRDLGKVSVSISEKDGLTIIYSKDFIQNEDETTQTNWYNFLKELRVFSKKRLLNFDVRDITKSNLNKRDYKFLATNLGDNTMIESKLYGTSRVSYQNVDNARLVIKHTESVNQELAGGRTRHIGTIYVESADGERFKYPYRHLTGARAMARHVSEGGKPYDDFGSHITGLSEEMSNLRKFRNYMGRSSVMAESLDEYMDVVKERISTVKKIIESLQKPNYYAEAVASFVKPVFEDVPDDVKDNWVDQLTIRQFNEELQDVFPYIYRLVSEHKKTKTLGPADLVAEADDPCWKDYKQIGMKKKNGKEVPNCVPEEEELEKGFDEMMGQFREDGDLEEAAVPPGYTMARIVKRKISAGQKRIGQMSGSTVKNANKDSFNLVAIFGNYQNPLELTMKSAEYSTSVRSPEHFIKIAQKRLQDPLHKTTGIVLFFTDAEAGSDTWAPYVDAIQELGDRKIQVSTRETRQSDGIGGKAGKVKSKDNDTGSWGSADAKKTAPDQTKTVVFRVENKKVVDFLKKKHSDYMMKYYKPATNEFVMKEKTFEKFKSTINSPSWIKKFGESLIMINREKSFSEDQTSTNDTPLGEFILSYFDRENGKFPKGETAILTMVEKEYGDEYIDPAKHFIERVNSKVAEMYGFRDSAMQEDDFEEGYKILPPIDAEKYQERSGLEGPFSTLSGKVVYYDPKEGSYYDPDTDMYISYDDFQKLDNDYSDMKDDIEYNRIRELAGLR